MFILALFLYSIIFVVVFLRKWVSECPLLFDFRFGQIRLRQIVVDGSRRKRPVNERYNIEWLSRKD